MERNTSLRGKFRVATKGRILGQVFPQRFCHSLMEEALREIFACHGSLNEEQLEQANLQLSEILADVDSFQCLFAILSDETSDAGVTFCVIGALRSWKAIHWDGLEEEHQMTVLGLLYPLLFSDKPTLPALLDLFYRMANKISLREAWDDLLLKTAEIPLSECHVLLLILKMASKYFQQIHIEWQTLQSFRNLTEPFINLEALGSPEQTAVLRLALESFFPLLFLYAVKGRAADESAFIEETQELFVECCRFLIALFSTEIEPTFEHIKLYSKMAKLIYEILVTMETTNPEFYESWREEILSVIWNKAIEIFQLFRGENKKYVANMLKPVAFFCRGLAVPANFFNWIVLFTALSGDDLADFTYNPSVYYSYAYSLESFSLRSCALIMAETMAQSMSPEDLVCLLEIIPCGEQGARLVAQIAKLYIAHGDEVALHLYRWIFRYMQSRKNMVEMATVLFLLSKSLKCITNRKDIGLIARIAYDFLACPSAVAASNAAKLIRKLNKLGLRLQEDAVPVLVDLVPWAATHDPLVLLNDFARINPTIYVHLAGIAECCMQSIFTALADRLESNEKDKLLEADFDLLIGIVESRGDCDPDFAQCLYEIVGHSLMNDTFDCTRQVLKLVTACIVRGSPKTLEYFDLLISLLRDSPSILDYLCEIVPIFMFFMTSNTAAFIQSGMGAGMFEVIVCLIANGSVEDRTNLFLISELLASILSIDDRFDGAATLPIISEYLSHEDDCLFVLSGFDLLSGYCTFRATDMTADVVGSWLEFVRSQMIYSYNRLNMHLNALSRVAPCVDACADAVQMLLAEASANPDAFIGPPEFIDALTLNALTNFLM